jgi:hypothetical protein
MSELPKSKESTPAGPKVNASAQRKLIFEKRRCSLAAKYDSYCGLFCGACGTLVATEKGGADARGEKCRGCKSDLLARGCLEKCLMRPCAIARGVDSCGDCAEFPCAVLLAFEQDGVPHHRGVTKSLRDRKAMGVTRWLEAQHKAWSCPACGTRFHWKQKTCESCGATVQP